MKYSVGDIFIDPFGNLVRVWNIIPNPSSGKPYYAVTFTTQDKSQKSHLRWYDHDLDVFVNISSPVLKELYS